MMFLAFHSQPYVCFCQSKCGHLVHGQVHTTAAPIFPNVAQDIGDLQSDTQLDRIGDGLFARETDDVHAHQSNGGCYAIGVRNHVLERAIAFLAHIAPDAVDELVSIGLGNLITNGYIILHFLR